MKLNDVSNKFISKFSYIRKLKDGKYRVFSRNGKNLGTYDSKEEAKSRLKEIEYFKKNASVDIEDADDFTYSAISRYLRKELSEKDFKKFQELYKKNFDELYLNDEKNFEEKALKKTINEIDFINKKANLQDLGSPEDVGKYLANIIRFTMNKISPLNREKSIINLKKKIYYLDENEIGSKKMPASASIGNALTFTKHILFSQDPVYIRSVLNNIVKNL